MGVAQDHGLEQVVLKPTGGNNILDLFFTSHPAKINRVEIMSQISDYNTVFLEVNLKAKTIKQKPRKIHLYNKGDWPAIQKGLADILDSLGTLQNINNMWLLFKTKCLDLMDRTFPPNLQKFIMACHGSTRTLNGLLDAAIQHGPSGKYQTLKLPTVITSGLKSMYNIASVWHTGTILMA